MGLALRVTVFGLAGAAGASATAGATSGEIVLPEDGINLEATLEQIERSLLRQALDRAGGVRTRAAQYLGLSFRSFRDRLQKIGMGGAELGDEDDAPAAPRAR